MKFVILKSDKLEVTLCTLGASIYRIVFDKHEMVLTPKDEKAFLMKDLYYGKTIGMVCGRIVINNQIVLHGGDEGLSNQEFDYKEELNKVIFSYGKIKVTYSLYGNELSLDFLVEVDKPTLVALTNHSYFCLGENDIKNLKLKINSHKYILVDKDLVPYGSSLISDKYDFSKYGCPIKDGDIDNYFYLDDKNVSLRSDKYSLDISFDFEGVQLFTDHWIDVTDVLSSVKHSYRSIAIEPEDDQLNRKELLPGQIYQRNIKYRFNKL